MLGDTGGDVWAATFHSTCARILRRDGDRIGYSSHFTVYDTDDSKRLVKDCQKALNIDDKMISHKSILSEISHAKDSMLSPADYQAAAGSDFRLAKIGAVYELYQKRLREADAIGFRRFAGEYCGAVPSMSRCFGILSKPVPLHHGGRVSGYEYGTV